MSFFPIAKRIDTYLGVMGDGNGVRRIKQTDKVIVELFERGSQMIVQAILDPREVSTLGLPFQDDANLPAEGTVLWLVPDSDRAPTMLRVLTDFLP